MSKRHNKKTRANQDPLRAITLHRNLVFVRTPDANILEEILNQANLRKKVVYHLDDTSILIPRSAAAAFQKRISGLDLPEIIVPSRSYDEYH